MTGSKASVQDHYFAAGWSLADEQKVQRYTDRLVSMYGNPAEQATYTRLADIMLDFIDHRRNDHRSAVAELGHDWLKVDPLSVETGEDMVTFSGLNKMLRIYLGLTTGVFKWVGRGDVAGSPTPYSTTLTSEVGTRLDSTVAGFQDLKGVSLRVFATYASSVATSTILQIGIFDASTSGTMLAIHDFGGIGHGHTINVDAFSLGIVIDWVPFGDV